MTRKKIKECATQLFFDKGFAATSMRELAKAVGIEAASIYSHFKNKQELLAAICIPLMKEMNSKMGQLAEMKRNPIAQLEEFISYYIDININNWYELHILQQDWKYLEDEQLEALKAERALMEDTLTGILEKGMEGGQFYQTDPSMVAAILLSTFRWRYKSPKKLQKARAKYISDIKHLLLQGIVLK